ncbi:PqqD family protein [bacterium]|nr:MAG: PqqD family protein [bacterium]
MSSQSVYERNASVDSSLAGDRVVLYERQSRSAIVLNPTGTHLWQTLSQPQTAQQLSEALCVLYPTLDSGQAKHDVETFLSDLSAKQLVQVRSK